MYNFRRAQLDNVGVLFLDAYSFLGFGYVYNFAGAFMFCLFKGIVFHGLEKRVEIAKTGAP